MKPILSSSSLNALVLLAFASVVASCSAPAPIRPAPALRTAGFDTRTYPGDDAMRAWASSSPYGWVGYYLPAPCRRDSSWVGARPRLQAMGWRLAVLYVGQQQWDGVPAVVGDSAAQPAQPAQPAAAGAAAVPACTRELLSASQGSLEGLDAVTRAAADGFPRGTTLYLDIEATDSLSTRLRNYERAWLRAVAQDGRYRPGIYAHHRHAAALHEDLRAVYDEMGIPGTPPFWVARSSSSFTLDQHPGDSGFPFATIWQGRLNLRETHGGVTLLIDANVAAGVP